jgi:hypothetical protein
VAPTGSAQTMAVVKAPAGRTSALKLLPPEQPLP